MAKFRKTNPRPGRKPIVIEEDFFSPNDDGDVTRFSMFSNRNNQRIQEILRRNGKVTWGDVYEPWLKNREWYDSKESVSTEEFMLFKTDPQTEMMCVLDEFDGHTYWVPKMNQKYLKKKNSWVSGLIKKLFLIGAVLLPLISPAQNYKVEDIPIVVPFAIGVNSVNELFGQTEHTPLTEECGYVKIPNTFYTHNGQSLGINVVQIWGGTYLAFEARCPVCFYEYHDPHPGKIDPDLPFSACDKCGASADNMKAQGATQMFGYGFKGMGPKHMDSYPIHIVEKENETYLLIYNAFNGVPDTWRKLPQNQIILETYREKYGKEYNGPF